MKLLLALLLVSAAFDAHAGPVIAAAAASAAASTLAGVLTKTIVGGIFKYFATHLFTSKALGSRILRRRT